MQTYKVYVKVDAAGRILAINSDAFMSDLSGWVLIDEGVGDRFHHAQGNYLPCPLTNENGVCKFKLVSGKLAERTKEEMDADYVEPEVQPTDAERIAALEEQNEMLLACILEMSELVYA